MEDATTTIEKIIQKFRKSQTKKKKKNPQVSYIPTEEVEVIFRCPHCGKILKWKEGARFCEIPGRTIPFTSGLRGCPKCGKLITRTDHLKQKDFEDFAEGVIIE